MKKTTGIIAGLSSAQNPCVQGLPKIWLKSALLLDEIVRAAGMPFPVTWPGPGKHLVIVPYEPDHYVHNEWVYNGADIDGGTVVWAREIPGVSVNPLLDYFRDRKVWMVEADLPHPALEPYRPPTESSPPLSKNP